MDDASSGPPHVASGGGGETEREGRSRRRSPRDSLFVHATIRRENEAQGHQVRVRNLSSHGMMAEIGKPFEPGDEIRIEMRGVGVIDGFIVWQVEQRAGVAFSIPIDPAKARKSVTVRPTSPAAPAAPLRPRRARIFGQ